MHRHLSTLEYVRDTMRQKNLDHTPAYVELQQLIYQIKCEILDMERAHNEEKKLKKSSSRRSA